MSSAERAASLITNLEPEEFRILITLELGMQKFSFVPLSDIVKYSGLNQGKIEHLIKGLDRKDLLYRQHKPYLGYILNYTGYDCLALNALVKMEMLNSLGRPLGVGKEADIYEAITDNDEQVAVKFHRLGRTSFRETRKKRGYVANRGHITWYYQSRLAAEKEYEFLKMAYSAGVAVPKPIAQNRHVIVMDFIDGVDLINVNEIEDTQGLLDEIIENIRITYNAGLIHGDLSSFNILLQLNGNPLFIDWPQAESVKHPNSKALIRRDVENVLSHFQRKYFIKRDLDETVNYVTSGTPTSQES
jgi:RIO kinase 2